LRLARWSVFADASTLAIRSRHDGSAKEAAYSASSTG
jgi:hypothetical protein